MTLLANGRDPKHRGFPLEQKYTSRSDKAEVQAGDEALLDILTSNLQRLPGNDNRSLSPGITMREAPVLGPVAKVTSAIAFAGLMMMAAVILAIFRLLPGDEDGGD
jgi:hypothetical protein